MHCYWNIKKSFLIGISSKKENNLCACESVNVWKVFSFVKMQKKKWTEKSMKNQLSFRRRYYGRFRNIIAIWDGLANVGFRLHKHEHSKFSENWVHSMKNTGKKFCFFEEENSITARYKQTGYRLVIDNAHFTLYHWHYSMAHTAIELIM